MNLDVIYKIGDTLEEQKKFCEVIRCLHSEHPNLNEILGVTNGMISKWKSGADYASSINIKKILANFKYIKPEDIGARIVTIEETKLIFSKRLNKLLERLDNKTKKGKSEWLNTKIGISSATSSKWLNGKDMPNDDNLNKLAKALKVSVYYLIGESKFENIIDNIVNSKTGLDEDDIISYNNIKRQSEPDNRLFEIVNPLEDITPLSVSKYIRQNTNFINIFVEQIKKGYIAQMSLNKNLKRDYANVKLVNLEYMNVINECKSEINLAMDNIFDEYLYNKINN